MSYSRITPRLTPRVVGKLLAALGAGWADPTGLTWAAAYDLTAANPANQDNLPALVGAAMTRTEGSFVASSGANMAGIDPEAYGLSSGTGINFATNTTFQSVIPDLNGLGAAPLHVRYIFRAEFDAARVAESRFTIVAGAIPGTVTGQVSIQASNTTTTVRHIYRGYTDGFLGPQTVPLEIADGWTILDTWVTDPAGGGTYEVRTLANGVAATVYTTTAHAWAGLAGEIFRLYRHRGDAVFVGIRQGVYDATAHAAARTLLGV